MSIELKRAPTEVEVEEICQTAETAARQFLLAKLSLKDISDLEVTVEALGDKPLTLNIGVALELASGQSDLDPIVDEAIDVAFIAAEAKARELQLCETTNS